MAKKKNNNVFNTQYLSGIAFVGASLTGIAFGILQNNLLPYLLLGVGAGFVLVGLLSVSSGNKNLHR